MPNVFKRAKSIQRQHPSMKWQSAIKKAGKEIRNKNRQTGTSNKKRDEARHAKKPGKRTSASGNTYYERRKNRSDKPKGLTGVSAATLKSELKGRKKIELARYLLNQKLVTTKRDKKYWGKCVTRVTKELKKLQ